MMAQRGRRAIARRAASGARPGEDSVHRRVIRVVSEPSDAKRLLRDRQIRHFIEPEQAPSLRPAPAAVAGRLVSTEQLMATLRHAMAVRLDDPVAATVGEANELAVVDGSTEKKIHWGSPRMLS